MATICDATRLLYTLTVTTLQPDPALVLAWRGTVTVRVYEIEEFRASGSTKSHIFIYLTPKSPNLPVFSILPTSKVDQNTHLRPELSVS